MKKTFLAKIMVAVTASAMLSGCASILTSYPSRMAPVKKQIAQKQFKSALSTLKKLDDASQNRQLYSIEAGRIDQLAGNYKQSQIQYHTAISKLRASQLAAKIQFKKILSNAGSLLTNDRAIPYTIKGYEAVFLYLYQAINYAALNDMTDALVSLRQGQNEQQFIRQQNYESTLAAQKKSKQEGWKFRYQDHAKYFKATMDAAKHIKNSFENAAFYYLSAVFFNAVGNQNTAFVDIKSALALAPNNIYIQRFLIQILEQRGGSQNQINTFMQKFGWSKMPSIPNHSGMIAVLYDQNWVPEIYSANVPLLLSNQVQTVAFPVYKPSKIKLHLMQVHLKQSSQKQYNHYKTRQLMNVMSLAAKSLENRYPMIFVREALRIIAKSAITNASDKKGGLVAGLIADIYSNITAGADQRSWLTLPHYIQIWQHYVKPGKYNLLLRTDHIKHILNIDIHSGQTLLIWVTHFGKVLIVHKIGL